MLTGLGFGFGLRFSRFGYEFWFWFWFWFRFRFELEFGLELRWASEIGSKLSCRTRLTVYVLGSRVPFS